MRFCFVECHTLAYYVDLPCLMSVTSCHQLLVHSLPGLKPLMKISFSPLHEAMVMCTFRVSGMGQALFLSSPSEIQRLSVVREDRYVRKYNFLSKLFIKALLQGFTQFFF